MKKSKKAGASHTMLVNIILTLVILFTIVILIISGVFDNIWDKLTSIDIW